MLSPTYEFITSLHGSFEVEIDERLLSSFIDLLLKEIAFK